MKYPLLRILLALFLAIIFIHNATEAQTRSKQKIKPKEQSSTPKLNQRQIEFILDLHYDMCKPASNAVSAFMYMSYNRDGTRGMTDIMVRISQGLKNENNLPTLIRYAKIDYGNLSAISLHSIFPSIEMEDCKYLDSISESDLIELAKKYSNILNKYDIENPKY